MSNNRFYLFLGKLSYTYSRIDFWLGYIGMHLGLSNSYIDFFSEQGIISKIDKIRQRLNDMSDKLEIPEAEVTLNELKEAIKKRNGLIHGLILSNENMLMIHYYKSHKSGAINNSYSTTIEELETFIVYFIGIHNKVYNLMLEIQTKTKNV